ncbi:MAG: hybrid sensor histidine kinase/response regulator [bacterium]|nr:hybrid sensor histidine kinase/response regulator [Planctomycetota bacterium]HIL52391.1 hybrid sensor histidine kinase/response regulator [Planctomycetota bacterium]
MTSANNRRILLIDDNASIHKDFEKILASPRADSSNLNTARAAFLGTDDDQTAGASTARTEIEFSLMSAMQGQEGIDLHAAACDRGEEFALAFVDMRMPPGLDGVQTIAKLWERDPSLQVVICTAFSDYTWEEMIAELGQSDRLLILKKPFDAIEVSQLATALTEKWNAERQAAELLADVRSAELEARSYAASLETVNRSLVTAKAAADMTADMQTEFLVQLTSEVSSKLEEVLASITSLAEQELLAQEGACPDSKEQEFSSTDKLQHSLQAVLDIGFHLMRTVGEILDVTRLETGEATLDIDRCSPSEMIESVLDEFFDAAYDKGLSLSFEVEDSLPDTIHTEARQLKKLLSTLVDNAVRYTSNGSISIKASLLSSASWQRPRMMISVTDTGCGIDREQLGTLFEPRARSESDATRNGYGFGLALAKRLVAQLGGDLTARSAKDGGSMFCLSLEIGREEGSRAA